jgi:hypothetical protein
MVCIYVLYLQICVQKNNPVYIDFKEILQCSLFTVSESDTSQ